ncbi:MAG TPA: hypothetical protein VMV61_12085 [Patescibacteria group bacterium]|nr:hypothetical protein [Patescibacteria group bacterium]
MTGLRYEQGSVPLGFNSDLKLGDLVLHIQTEDRRPRSTAVDTTVYAGGRVVYRRKTSYDDQAHQPGFDDASVRQLLEDQHRSILEGLRSGEIAVDTFPPPPARTAPSSAGDVVVPGEWPNRTGTAIMPAPPSLIRVLLTNPASWLSAGSARLLIEVRAREPERPIPDAVVEVSFEGAPRPLIFKTITDAQGRAEVGFPLPKFGPSGASLVIRASCEAGHDEIRYSLRPKSSNSGD